MNERKYVAIDIEKKHYKTNKLTLMFWGDKRTKDDEKRCFSGYTKNIDQCELYTIEEFANDRRNDTGYLYRPLQKMNMAKINAARSLGFHTVLVNIDVYRNWVNK